MTAPVRPSAPAGGPRAYYNEVDAYAAEWIRNLIAAALITAGDVDTRSIVDVQPSDLRGYTRCHFFAGIAVWDYALRLAGWPADRPVWTGSCPCQPFSAAGRRAGIADERHLWPAWHHLIAECRPATVVGEQVASADGLAWLDLVHADMDGLGYTFGAADLCAAGVGAPHIRQRLWFVADADGRHPCAEGLQRGWQHRQQPEDRLVSVLADAASERWHGSELAGAAGATAARCAEAEGRRPAGLREPAGCSAAVLLGDTGEQRLSDAEFAQLRGAGRRGEGAAAQQPSHTFWSGADWLWCRDRRWRPVEPGTFPLVASAPARMGRLRAYGNAINAEAAAAFIAACLDVLPDHEVAA
ncbi:DNA cytosine methyltransferase [Methylobacterium hispanicum]|uniref:DNA cytosine methyltransferase n=1 Tax=Methylobacterium hispanicum TaxID=270350 RepID=UPI002F2BD5FB